MACDHHSFQSGAARYAPETRQLRLVRICDECGQELAEIGRMDYALKPRRLVVHLVELTAQELHMDLQGVARLRTAALVCDVGPLADDQQAPTGMEALRPEAWGRICGNPDLAAVIVAEATSGEVAKWVAGRRAKASACSYPEQLRGRRLPVEAQVLALCVAHAAMVAEWERRYALAFADGGIELSARAGGQLDPAVVCAFARAWRTHDQRLDRAAA